MTLAEKVCTACKILKPIDQFYVAKNGKAQSKPIIKAKCKDCMCAAMRAWAKTNTQRSAFTRFIHNLSTRYNMSMIQYLMMLDLQDGKCAICDTAEETKLGPYGTTQRMSVDHCHIEGHVRGLLCNRCNRALGLLGDNTDLLRKAISYLERK